MAAADPDANDACLYADVEQAIMQLYDRTAEALLGGLLRVSSSALANTIKGFGDNARVLVGTGALLLERKQKKNDTIRRHNGSL